MVGEGHSKIFLNAIKNLNFHPSTIVYQTMINRSRLAIHILSMAVAGTDRARTAFMMSIISIAIHSGGFIAWHISRSKELLELTARQSVQFRSGYIGRDAEVLLEEEREIDGRVYLVGHTKDYVKAAVDITEKTSSALPVLNTVVKIPVKKFLTDEILV